MTDQVLNFCIIKDANKSKEIYKDKDWGYATI